MIPWWAGVLLFVSGILLGGFIVFLNECEDEPTIKYLRKRR